VPDEEVAMTMGMTVLLDRRVVGCAADADED